MESMLNRADELEEEKNEVTKTYNLKNKRGLTSQIGGTTKKPGPAEKPPVSSGKAIFKTKTRKEMAQEAEAKMYEKMAGGGGGGSDTFLTGLGGKKKSSRSAAKPPTGASSNIDGRSSVADSEMNAADIEDELRDVVFDYEGSKELVLAADAFLAEGKIGDTKSVSGTTDRSMRSNASDRSKIIENKRGAGSYNPYKIKLLQDRLDEKGKSRLADMLKEIDETLPELMKEKNEYSKMLAGKKNAFENQSSISR